VPRRGLEPPCLSAVASKTTVYTIPPSGQILAEVVGFEPTVPVKERQFSRLLRSTALPHFHSHIIRELLIEQKKRGDISISPVLD
jgi:hypothetical protein